MKLFVTIAGGGALAAWVYLLLGRGRFWSVQANSVPSTPDHQRNDAPATTDLRDQSGGRPKSTGKQPSAHPTLTGDGWSAEPRPHGATSSAHTMLKQRRVVAVVPARNEADVIARSIASLLGQADLDRVVVVDDHSSDATVERAREAAKRNRIGADDRLVIVTGRELPPGWSGKVWAMRQGIDAALSFAPDYLLLTDADVVHKAASVRTLVGIAEERRRDLVSLMARLHCESWTERLLIPAFVFFFFKLYPPRWIADKRRAVAGAAGGCILIRPEALARAGGVEAIRGEIIDDCALAAAVKRSGGTIELALTDLVHSERPYNARDIWRMISRTAFSQLRHSALILAGAMAGLGLLYVAPVMLVASGTRTGLALGGATWALMVAAYLPMVRFYRGNPAWALTLPLAAVFYIGATVHSAVSFWRGCGGVWKGRVQDPIAAKP